MFPHFSLVLSLYFTDLFPVSNFYESESFLVPGSHLNQIIYIDNTVYLVKQLN